MSETRIPCVLVIRYEVDDADPDDAIVKRVDFLLDHFGLIHLWHLETPAR